jgi:hypothetical protein
VLPALVPLSVIRHNIERGTTIFVSRDIDWLLGVEWENPARTYITGCAAAWHGKNNL